MTTLHLSLVAHTNVGKTTLARTLLRQDVGEVLDHAHVTDQSEGHVLIEAGEDQLQLWDTPGFGDSARLARRLSKDRGTLGRFLGQAWDRLADRPLWCSQEALRNVRDQADVVLYLVNAAEHPDDAGYLHHELTILEWMERPVLCLLNQAGQGAGKAWVEDWRKALSRWPAVRGVLELDAFARSWRQETRLFEGVAELLVGEKQAAMERLSQAWSARGEATFAGALEAMGAHLVTMARDREPLPGTLASKSQKQRAVLALAERAAASERGLWERLIELHELEGRASVELRRELEDCLMHGQDELDPKRGALLGGAVSGALGGLAADVMAGGMTFGGGLVAGTLLGALGGAGLARGMRYLKSGGTPAVTWTPERLDASLREVCIMYASVTHFGRGRGPLDTRVQPAAWRDVVEAEWKAQAEDHPRPWNLATKDESWAERDVELRVRRLLREMCEALL